MIKDLCFQRKQKNLHNFKTRTQKKENVSNWNERTYKVERTSQSFGQTYYHLQNQSRAYLRHDLLKVP